MLYDSYKKSQDLADKGEYFLRKRYSDVDNENVTGSTTRYVKRRAQGVVSYGVKSLNDMVEVGNKKGKGEKVLALTKKQARNIYYTAESSIYDVPGSRDEMGTRTIEKATQTPIKAVRSARVGTRIARNAQKTITTLISNPEIAVVVGVLILLIFMFFTYKNLQASNTTRSPSANTDIVENGNGLLKSPFIGIDWRQRISSKFGEWRPATQTYHGGIDIALTQGTPINACMSGTVNVPPSGSAYGHYAMITNGKYTTVYAHMVSRPIVFTGQIVKAGDVIGYVGSTGRSSGPHLHLELRIDGKATDPLPYLE